jgi:hypothetical protein
MFICVESPDPNIIRIMLCCFSFLIAYNNCRFEIKINEHQNHSERILTICVFCFEAYFSTLFWNQFINSLVYVQTVGLLTGQEEHM